MSTNSNEQSIPARQTLSPHHRKRLQECFEVASKNSAKGSYDYATTLLMTCVLGDLGNSIYLQTFLGNLHKKYNDNKKGSKLAGFKTARSKAILKKARMQKNWMAVVKTGLEILKVNPWDLQTLLAMAQAADEMGFEEIPLIYLRLALEVNPKDAEVNRQCGRALRARGQFDQAIACWARVKHAVPDDKEAVHELAELAVEKTIDHGGYDGAKSSRDVKVEKEGGRAAARPGAKVASGDRALSPVERLRKEISRDPSNVGLYLQLAEEHFRNEDYESAQEVMREAYDASNGDLDIREKYEDAQLRLLRSKLSQADRDFRDAPTDENKRSFASLRKMLFEKEREMYENRCQRYPHNLEYKYHLGVRYQQLRQFSEAIQQFQTAQNDVRYKARALLNLGQCFEKIGQTRLAIQHYDMAVKELTDRDEMTRKLALYSLGSLLLANNDWENADKHLSTLAAIDFGYKDVSKLLDKIAELRNNS